ncbi:MAG TPA: hypothetical protein VKE24_00850 [Candidatus Acidoferrales bacterium]|nr:hypothetical protein [Candidatus Acidoferrales bacterium]
MNRVLHVLLILLCFELGVLLVFLPWSGAWDHNYFLNRYPALIPYVLNPSVRGVITGLGLLDIVVAGNMLRRRRPATVATRS